LGFNECVPSKPYLSSSVLLGLLQIQIDTTNSDKGVNLVSLISMFICHLLWFLAPYPVYVAMTTIVKGALSVLHSTSTVAHLISNLNMGIFVTCNLYNTAH